jgi:RNA polymerase sigma-70 factor, ECF subfamily
MNLSKAQPSVFLVGIDGVALDPFVVFAEDTIDNPEASQTAIDVTRVTTLGPQDHTAFFRAERRSDLVRRALDVMPIQAFREGLLGELGGLRAFAVFLTGSHDKAGDLLEATLLRAWSLRATFLWSMDMRPWLIRTMRQAYYWNFHCAASTAAAPNDSGRETRGKYSGHLAASEMAAFRTAFVKLSPELRWALLMVEASRLSHEETARICGVPVNTIRDRIDRAHAELAGLLRFTRFRQGNTTGARI